MSIKLHELFRNISFEQLWSLIKELHNKECDFDSLQKQYKEAFYYVTAITPLNNEDMRICLSWETDNIDSENDPSTEAYINVSGRKNGGDELERYCLTLTRWNEWLGMDVDPLTLETFNREQILSNCLYEMTYYGFTEEEIDQTREWVAYWDKVVDKNHIETVSLDDLDFFCD